MPLIIGLAQRLHQNLFRKLRRSYHRRLSFTIGTDENASYPEAFAASVKEKVLPADCKLRGVKYLNNVIEQDYRADRRRAMLPLLLHGGAN